MCFNFFFENNLSSTDNVLNATHNFMDYKYSIAFAIQVVFIGVYYSECSFYPWSSDFSDFLLRWNSDRNPNNVFAHALR